MKNGGGPTGGTARPCRMRQARRRPVSSSDSRLRAGRSKQVSASKCVRHCVRTPPFILTRSALAVQPPAPKFLPAGLRSQSFGFDVVSYVFYSKIKQRHPRLRPGEAEVGVSCPKSGHMASSFALSSLGSDCGPFRLFTDKPAQKRSRKFGLGLETLSVRKTKQTQPNNQTHSDRPGPHRGGRSRARVIWVVGRLTSWPDLPRPADDFYRP